MNSVRNHVRNYIWGQIANRLSDQVDVKARGQVWHQDQVQVWDRFRNVVTRHLDEVR